MLWRRASCIFRLLCLVKGYPFVNEYQQLLINVSQKSPLAKAGKFFCLNAEHRACLHHILSTHFGSHYWQLPKMGQWGPLALKPLLTMLTSLYLSSPSAARVAVTWTLGPGWGQSVGTASSGSPPFPISEASFPDQKLPLDKVSGEVEVDQQEPNL